MQRKKKTNQAKALAEYSRTKDVIHLHHRLGYKRIGTTLALLERSNMIADDIKETKT